MGIPKPVSPQADPTVPMVKALGGLLASCPTVMAYLSDDRYEGGEPRQRSTMTVFVEEGLVKACLSDRDLQRSLWATGDTLEDVVLGLEIRLGEANPDWRKAAAGGGKRRR